MGNNTKRKRSLVSASLLALGNVTQGFAELHAYFVVFLLAVFEVGHIGHQKVEVLVEDGSQQLLDIPSKEPCA